MPIYEFECSMCKKRTEKFFKLFDIYDEFHYQCEKCGGEMKKLISRIGRINMNPGPLTGVDDTDELTLGKLVAEGGMPAEHKRQYAEHREKHKRITEYEKELKIREKKYGFKAETIKEIKS